MHIKEHHFTLIIKTHGSRRSAETSVLAAFGKRQPDGCGFFLKNNPNHEAEHKASWMAGANAGCDVAFELIERFIAKLKKQKPKYK